MADNPETAGTMATQAKVRRLRISILGAVQGVGFRPHAHRVATRLGLKGWIVNSSAGVLLEIEGGESGLHEFLIRIEQERPPRAAIHSLEAIWLDPVGFLEFEIRPSADTGDLRAIILPDIATCPECLREMFDPGNRRYRYPFINCVNCGPRFSIIKALPYDRANTTMTEFRMCPECENEFHDPSDRRFHAQPNACSSCGPSVRLMDAAGQPLADAEEAVSRCVSAVRDGLIVAVKGIGGFHLVVDARNEDAVLRLRHLKHREEKPFAVLFPSLEAIERACHVSAAEQRLLKSPEAPIVLLSRREQDFLAASVAPRNPCCGAMLPSSPLHHLLMAEIGHPVVATSGNISDEPICAQNDEALRRLRGIADLFLAHDRSIARHLDDSVTRVMLGRELVLRRSRGYAPLPLDLPVMPQRKSILAVGGHLKSTVALALDSQAFVSQHIGDLDSDETFTAFRKVISDIETIYQAPATQVVADEHPDYASTRYAIERKLPLRRVQHHLAHVLACMAENQIDTPVLGVAWDGAGYGLDGTVWGGEFFHVDHADFNRLAALLPFPLPGGDAAAREPRRAAMGLLYTLEGAAAFRRTKLSSARSFAPSELKLLRQLLSRGINSPRTSSVGRLFDAVASLLGIRQRSAFEAQAAMELEFAASGIATREEYPFRFIEHASGSTADARWWIDWRPMVTQVLADLAARQSNPIMAAKFHNTLAAMIVAVAQRSGLARVALSGGCFQNRKLAERVVTRLQESGFQPYWHQRIPPNDGGIALGQLYAVMRERRLISSNKRADQ